MMRSLWSSLRRQRAVLRPRNFSTSVCRGRPTAAELPWSVVKPFGSIRVNLTKAHSEGWDHQDSFLSQLQRHEQEWKSRGHSAVWLHIPIPLSSLVGEASEHGYIVHHGSCQEIVMNKWLCETRINRLPHYASHQVGVCGVVVRDDKFEVLVTQDRYKPPLWKFPGGLAEIGEDISSAAVREVKEETGIASEFRSILAFREQHNLLHYFGVSDMYFVCRMHPRSLDIDRCTHEVIKCEWKPVEEMAVSEDSTVLTKLVSKLLVEGQTKGFEHIDINEHEIEANIPQYSGTRMYKLFTRYL